MWEGSEEKEDCVVVRVLGRKERTKDWKAAAWLPFPCLLFIYSTPPPLLLIPLFS